MRRNCFPFLVVALCLFWGTTATAQAPVITCQTPQHYSTGNTITTLHPDNTGGPVPATPYGQPIVLAGSGTTGFADGIGTEAVFQSIVDVIPDAAGNIYVSDMLNFMIRKIALGGVVTTFAGDGRYVIIDGKGSGASFKGPQGITIDASGNLYVTEPFGDVIRKITPDGEVTTFAGTGARGDTNGPSATATFDQPQGITVDGNGNIYVSQYGGCLIRKINPAGLVSTFAGNGSCSFRDGNGIQASFNNPQQLAVDVVGNIYVADFDNKRIRKITPNGDVTTVLSATAQNHFEGAPGIAVDKQGNIYTADPANGNIMKIDALTNRITHLSPTGSVPYPEGLAVDAKGSLYVANVIAGNVLKIPITGYAIDKALPAGLTFNPSTGEISGTPTQASPLTTYTVTAYNIYGSATATVDIEVLDAQGLTFPPIPDKAICSVDFDPGATSASPVTYTSSDPAVAAIVGGKVHITGAGTTIITASDGNSTVPQTLKVTASVTPSVSITPVSVDGCAGNTVSFTALVANGGVTLHYQFQINGEDAGTDDPLFSRNSLKDGDKITCILTSTDACGVTQTASSNEATFTLDPPVTTSVVITSSLTGPVCAGTYIKFAAIANTPDINPQYDWQVNGHDVNAYSATFGSTTLADGDVVTCIISSVGNCVINPLVASNAVTIKLNPVSQCDILIPNTFTPNGDGVNDLWNVPALLYYPDCSITIFSRYGAVVYKSTGYVKPWDGTSKNIAVPVGVYYYVIDLKDGRKPVSGSVTLLR